MKFFSYNSVFLWFFYHTWRGERTAHKNQEEFVQFLTATLVINAICVPLEIGGLFASYPYSRALSNMFRLMFRPGSISGRFWY